MTDDRELRLNAIGDGGPMNDNLYADYMLDLAAAAFVARFGSRGAREAWQRAFQSYGWENDPVVLTEWEAQVARGQDFARQLGFRPL